MTPLMASQSSSGNVVLFYFQAKYQYLLQADGKGYIFTNLTAISTVLTSLSKIVLIRRGANIVLRCEETIL